MILRIHAVFNVLENRVEINHTLPCQQADIMDQPSNTTGCKGATGEANQDDLVTRDIVGGYEGVGLANVLRVVRSK